MEAIKALEPEGKELQRLVVKELGIADLRDLGIDEAAMLRAVGL